MFKGLILLITRSIGTVGRYLWTAPTAIPLSIAFGSVDNCYLTQRFVGIADSDSGIRGEDMGAHGQGVDEVGALPYYLHKQETPFPPFKTILTFLLKEKNNGTMICILSAKSLSTKPLGNRVGANGTRNATQTVNEKKTRWFQTSIKSTDFVFSFATNTLDN